jgi:hypothetical protein
MQRKAKTFFFFLSKEMQEKKKMCPSHGKAKKRIASQKNVMKY